MQYRNLGHSGLKVSAIGLGTNQFGGKADQETVNDILAAARDTGINFIDTADVYQKGRSEETIGNAIQSRRGAYLIATKFRHPTGDGPNEGGTSRHHIMESIHASLRRLNTDYIDLYQVHSWDADTPLEEMMRTLEDLLRAGKVRYIGASNFTAWQLTRANALAEMRGWTQFVSIQPHYHMFERKIEGELIPACEYLNVGVLPYFPLAGGFLTGKYRRGEPAPAGSRGETSPYVQRHMTDANFDKVEKLIAFAEARQHSLNDLAHAWLLAQPQIASVISGATKVEHVVANAKAGDWALSDEEDKEVRAILEG
ncbi:MAG: aldo/keto reductase [Anaerolineae bacterium]|nr:aldo/keto reductase [Anaerolineae bacterium]